MKKAFVILLCFLAFISCKTETKNETVDQAVENEETRTLKQSDGLTLLKGEFIYYGDAAVLQTHKEMYGVIIDSKMHELNTMAQKFKTEDTDFVKVEIRGKITPKLANEEGWPYRVAIKEILNVNKTVGDNSEIVKLGKE